MAINSQSSIDEKQWRLEALQLLGARVEGGSILPVIYRLNSANAPTAPVQMGYHHSGKLYHDLGLTTVVPAEAIAQVGETITDILSVNLGPRSSLPQPVSLSQAAEVTVSATAIGHPEDLTPLSVAVKLAHDATYDGSNQALSRIPNSTAILNFLRDQTGFIAFGDALPLRTSTFLEVWRSDTAESPTGDAIIKLEITVIRKAKT